MIVGEVVRLRESMQRTAMEETQAPAEKLSPKKVHHL
jgi:hypothetical protein